MIKKITDFLRKIYNKKQKAFTIIELIFYLLITSIIYYTGNIIYQNVKYNFIVSIIEMQSQSSIDMQSMTYMNCDIIKDKDKTKVIVKNSVELREKLMAYFKNKTNIVIEAS